MPHRVLLIDDSPIERAAYRGMLDQQMPGLSIEEAGTAKEAMQRLLERPYECVFLDFLLPDGDGVSVLKAVERGSSSPVVMLTGSDDIDTAVEALKAGAIDFLVKDRVNAISLAGAVQAAVLRGDQLQARQARNRRLVVLQGLLQQSEHAYLIVDLSTHLLIEASAVGLARLGYRRGDVIDRDVRTLDLFAGNGGWEAFAASLSPDRSVPWRPGSPSDRPRAQVTAQVLKVDGRPYLMAIAKPL